MSENETAGKSLQELIDDKRDLVFDSYRKRGEGNGKRKTYSEVTDAEKQAMFEKYDEVAWARRAGKHHPIDPETGDPLCLDIHPAREEEAAGWPDGPTDVIPHDWRPMCRRCAHVWRERENGNEPKAL